MTKPKTTSEEWENSLIIKQLLEQAPMTGKEVVSFIDFLILQKQKEAIWAVLPKELNPEKMRKEIYKEKKDWEAATESAKFCFSYNHCRQQVIDKVKELYNIDL